MILDEMIKKIQESKRIVVFAHVNPDGDAMGSSLGMYLALKGLNKDVDLVIPEYAKCFEFLPGIDEIKKEGTGKYDLAIALDCASQQRLADPTSAFPNSDANMQIDHHVSNSMYADFNYVDPVSPACCQILIKVLNYWNIEVTKDIGKCLLTGIITDTGGFAYEGVSAETFEIVAGLLNKGINISNIYKKVLQTRTKEKFELIKLATNRLEFYQNDKVAFTYITLDDEKRLNTGFGDYEGCVEIGRDIEGVEVSVFMREVATGGFKVSMRSNEYVNVSDICLMFGGGGHVKAAGCTITTGTLEQIRDKIINQIKLYLK